MIKQSISAIISLAIAAGIIAAFVLAFNKASPRQSEPWENVPKTAKKTDHSNLYKVDSFADGPAVTRACLDCHPKAAEEVMKTSHWTWLGDPEQVPGHPGEDPVRIGKKNLINNFCISVESNWPKCTSCHAGYGWTDESFDFSKAENVDCLVCHDHSGAYAKAAGGLPAEDADLMEAAKSVGRPTRDNCGYCHFNGGGGNAVKHGDLDGSLAKPVERVDVHMGRNDFACVDCHRTADHRIGGRMISVSATDTIAVRCVDCHQLEPHRIGRLNDHTAAVACQSCHVPVMAVKQPTKMAWDWSTAGQDLEVDDPHAYLKIKGSFRYAKQVPPEYYWFNGDSYRYLKGDRIDPEAVTSLNYPAGGIEDPESKIFPFKVHRAKQPYDKKHKHLLIPKTVGKGGYWTDFDWDQAFRLGSEASGLAYSGEYGFAETEMYWLISHMVAPRERALQCADCHGDGGRLDWRRLGYDGDPAFTGGRRHKRLVSGAPEAAP